VMRVNEARNTLAGQRTTRNAALEAARRYAALGYPVFPLQPGEKRPHPRLAPNGFRGASRDPATLEAWWRLAPGAGVGIAPGPSVLVLDADSEEALEALQERWPELRTAPLQRTPRGGGHLFLSVPPEVGRAIPARAKALDGLADVRGLARSYLAAWPTALPHGRYVWERPLVSPSELPEAPASLVAALLPPPPPEPKRAWTPPTEGASPKRLEGLLRYHAEQVAKAPEGTRHLELLRRALVVGGLLPHGLDRGEAEAALTEAGLACGLPLREVQGVLAWALPRGEARPLHLGGDFGAPERFWSRGVLQNLLPSLSQKPDFGVLEYGSRGKPRLGVSKPRLGVSKPKLGGW